MASIDYEKRKSDVSFRLSSPCTRVKAFNQFATRKTFDFLKPPQEIRDIVYDNLRHKIPTIETLHTGLDLDAHYSGNG
jgi:hypothetical protein